MRRSTAATEENRDRWLVSYADFITLLLAFFVVMFASSRADKSRVKQVADSVRDALASGLGSSGRARAARGSHTNPPRAELARSLEVLSKELSTEIASGSVRLSMGPRGLTVSFLQKTLFPSGEDVIATAAYSSIGRVAAALEKVPNQVRLEGHTDTVPIHNSRFDSNWELSAARSIAVLKLLTGRFGVPESRLAVAGYAGTAPVSANDDEEGRSRNRRVDVVILNEAGAGGEPDRAALPLSRPSP